MPTDNYLKEEIEKDMFYLVTVDTIYKDRVIGQKQIRAFVGDKVVLSCDGIKVELV